MAITKNKKSQFFLMSLVLVYLAIIVIFTYIRSADYTSVSLFDKDTKLELDNVVEQLKTRNQWLPGDGVTNWNGGYEHKKRKLITINWLAAPAPNFEAEVDPGIVFADFEDCMDYVCCVEQVRVYTLTGTSFLYSDTTTPDPPCKLVLTLNNLAAGYHYYYVYYDNIIGVDPGDGRAGGATGSTDSDIFTYTIGPTEYSPPFSFCSHLESIYPSMGIAFNCTNVSITTVAPINRTNITFIFTATDLKFNGTAI